MQSVAVGGQRLRVAITSGPNGPGREPRIPLLLINGIGASLEALEPFVTALDGAVEVNRLIAGMLTELGHDQADVLGISWGGHPGLAAARLPGGHLGLLTEAAGLAPVVDGFLSAS